MAKLLTQTEIQQLASQIPDWTVEGKELKLVKIFKDFVEAIAVVNKRVEPAEMAGHHPDLVISYNKVIVSLTPHDAGGLTEKDFALAKEILAL